MSVFYDRQEELEKYEFMMGEARGRLAVTLDVLTDALILVGQHGVYCTSARNPKVPALDLQAVLANITGAKELVASVMEKLRLEKEAAEQSYSALTVTYWSVVPHLTWSSVLPPLVFSKEMDMFSCEAGRVLPVMGVRPRSLPSGYGMPHSPVFLLTMKSHCLALGRVKRV